MSRKFATLSTTLALVLVSAPSWAQDDPDDPIGDDPIEDPQDPQDPEDEPMPGEQPDQPLEEPEEVPDTEPVPETEPPETEPIEPVEPVEPAQPAPQTEPIEEPPPPPPPQPRAYVPTDDDDDDKKQDQEREPVILTPMGLSVSLGAGVHDFWDNNFENITDPGAGWEVRIATGTRMPIGLEVAYVGSVQDIDALGLDDDAVIVSNGGEANLRVNFSNFSRFEPLGLQPFVVGGVGIRRFSIVNESFNTSNVRDADTVFEAPVGGGLSFRANRLVLDLRGAYRFAFDEDLIDDEGIEDAEDAKAMDSWNVLLTGGMEF